MSYPHRCTRTRKCGYRKSFKFKKHKEALVTPPICPKCKIGKMTFDKHTHKRHKLETCYCPGAPYVPNSDSVAPHRKGSSVWCEYHPTGPTKEDQENYAYYSVLPENY